MNPLPRCMAVQLSDRALVSVKPFETTRHQKTAGNKTSSGLLGNGPAVPLNEIGRSALSLACCVYSVPLHATYIPNAHLTILFFSSYPLKYLFVLARSRKLLGHWAKPFPVVQKTNKKEDKKKQTPSGLLVPGDQVNWFSHHAVTAFYFTLKALFLTTKSYFHHVLYVLMLYVFICSIYLFG